MATKIGNGFKLVNGPGGKTKLVPDKKARMAKLDVSTRLKAEHQEETKVRYRGVK